MHLKSIALKGFKSFPDRTRLDFGTGVSVIVGPNGSGKSNITDAVLWALGEQSPLAVRGQTMQDVVFAGGHGVKGSSAAEVEVVIDNADGRLRSEFSEIAVSRRIDRSGEGVYRLNGARCRLVDVLEVLSDSGLGKEMHSVISQGKVEAIIHSKPADRTAMIEEAAGLTKHRKRRHRAQLKLRRTQDNLDRALDVEREARSRLRPLKRQAEAAELHARLERQLLEARGALAGEGLRAAREELAGAERAAVEARSRRDAVEADLMDVATRREAAETAFTEHGREREMLSAHMFSARSASERISIRLESAGQSLRGSRARLERSQRALAALAEQGEPGGEQAPSRLGELEAELERVERERAARIEQEIAGIEGERAEAERRSSEIAGRIRELEEQAGQAAAGSEGAAADRRQAAERADEAARRHAKFELELEAIEDRLRIGGEAAAGGPSLSEEIEVDPGYEAALAAALGGRLRARVVASLAEGERVVEAGEEGGRALVGGSASGGLSAPGTPPAPGAERLLDRVRAGAAVAGPVRLLLADAWVVPSLSALPGDFRGIAVTRAGTVYDGGLREVRRLPADAAERALADRNRRIVLLAEQREAADGRDAARAAADRAAAEHAEAERRREVLDGELREMRRREAEAREEARRAEWLAGQRREHGGGPEDARRVELVAEIAAERRLDERLVRERAEREARRQRLEALIEHDGALAPVAAALIASLERAREAVSGRLAVLERELAAGESAGEEVAAELRRLARREYEVQSGMRDAAEALTQTEVRVAHDRDREEALAADLAGIAGRLGVALEAPAEPLPAEEREQLEGRVERLERRRESLGPVNPLAEQEYEEALAHVDELESQRKDLEAALAELRGLIRETDRRIREAFEETFDAAARNFGEVIARLFPGGSGRLRRVSAPRPRAVLGGEDAETADGAQPAGAPPFGAGAEADGQAEAQGADPGADVSGAVEADGDPFDADVPGIEIEVTPAGKTTRRLSLLSGGEKSLVALAFMFAVFLARPCPFYILDEVEAALDDTNIGRFLDLISTYADRAQFIVITHQRRTMEAADVLYGVSMGRDGVSKVVSRRLEPDQPREDATPAAQAA